MSILTNTSQSTQPVPVPSSHSEALPRLSFRRKSDQCQESFEKYDSRRGEVGAKAAVVKASSKCEPGVVSEQYIQLTPGLRAECSQLILTTGTTAQGTEEQARTVEGCGARWSGLRSRHIRIPTIIFYYIRQYPYTIAGVHPCIIQSILTVIYAIKSKSRVSVAIRARDIEHVHISSIVLEWRHVI
ncbi:hypothetical protein BV25DRAFT_1963542 [Artomyces pyxidatus]|uniref:Uncharacterized protein n=1 Tax=Artomyces pyxidatus TaxID=48021 RepID=A0ACB8SSE3_9AGAM|nr:hypothetical protein BV25DRAFT_1963542 [Artomyces pyxidatus]